MNTPTSLGASPDPSSHPHTPSQPSGRQGGTQTTPYVGTAPRKPQRARGLGRSLLSWLLVIGGAVLVSTLIREFVIGNHYVYSASMEPTMKVGERFVTLRPTVHPAPPERGDIILFQDTGDWMGNGPEAEDAMLKRVIALAGDTVEASQGVVYLNGEPMEESYTDGVTGFFPPQTVPAGHMWVMGDNRENSADSRAHIEDQTQFVPVDSILGWPWGRYQPDLALY